MQRLTFVTIACVLAAVLVQHAQSCCDKGCSKEDKCSCEDHSGECKDKSEHCEKFKPHCENFFFRKCIRCACMRTCGICKVKELSSSSSSSSSEEEGLDTDPPTIPTPASTTQAPNRTASTITKAATTASTITDEPSITTTEEPTTSRRVEVMKEPEQITVQEPSPTSTTVDPFKDDNKVKCMSCNKRRKELKTLYEKYYPKDQQDQEGWDKKSIVPLPTHDSKKK